MRPNKIKTKGLENRSQSSSSTITQFNFSLLQHHHQHQKHPLSLFPVGSEVEITSDEEGFKGAWYLATVIDPTCSKSHLSLSSKLFVEYKNLLAEENGSTLLKEFVDVGFVRPKPPIDDEKDEVFFEVNDVVDAFFQDGWWTGVVSEVIGGERERDFRYRVFFSNPPEEIEFGRADLRVHRNWVDGKWVRPEKERMRELDFSAGAAVEVNIDPDNSPDVWFPATFIRKVTYNCFLVEYQTSQEAGLQHVGVDSDHIRPSPPQSSNKGFSLLEKVDAFHDFRWLSGVVTKILADGRYIVYFKRTKKEKELSHADLRLHMEWTNGKWVHSSQDSLITSASEKQLDSAVNDGHKEKNCAPAGTAATNEHVREERNHTVTLESCHKVLQTPDSEKADNKSTMSSNKRIKQASGDVDTRRLKSSKRMNEKTASDAPLSPESCKLRLKLTEVLHNGASTALDSSPMGNPGKSSSKQSDNSNQSSNPTGEMGDNEQHPVRRKRGRPPKREKSPKLQALEKDAVEQTPNKSGDLFPHGPIIVGLTHNGKMIESVSGSSGLHMKGESSKVMEDEEKHSNTEANHESVGSEQQKDGEVTNLKRKRGRPPKVLFRVGGLKTKAAPENVVVESKDSVYDTKDTSETVNEVEKPVTDAESARISNSNASSVVSRRRRWKIINNPIRRLITTSSSGRVIKKVSQSPEEIVTIETSEPVRPVTLGRGRRQKPTKQVEPPTEDTGDHLIEKAANVLDNGAAKDVETLGGALSNVSDDDRPLSAWFEGAHSPPTTDGRLPLATETTGQCDETSERHEINKTEHVIDQQPKDKDQEKENESTVGVKACQEDDATEREDQSPTQSTAIVPVDNQDLPFVKTSLIWSMIESMEVIKRIPQKPHFRSLYNCKEECREGLAIGNMVTFTSLVDRISRLQFDDPKSVLDGYFDALADLEELGFNVGPVRDRLNTLLSIKGRYEQTQNTAYEIETQIVERDHEKSKIDEEIEEIDKKIAELNEKRALAMSKREMKDAEMSLLKSSVDAVKGSLESSKEEFEKVATSRW